MASTGALGDAHLWVFHVLGHGEFRRAPDLTPDLTPDRTPDRTPDWTPWLLHLLQPAKRKHEEGGGSRAKHKQEETDIHLDGVWW